MVFAKWEKHIVDAAGNIITNATVEVRRMVGGYPLAVPLYADRDGNTHKDNPFTLTGGDEGRAKFYAVGGRYRIRVYAPGGYDVTYDDEAIGTAQATDTNAYLTPGYTWAPEDQITAPPSAGAVRANNADWSIADHLFVHKSTLSSSEAEAWLLGLAQGGKSIRNRLLLSIADGREMSWEVAGASDEGDYVDLTLDVASYQGPAGPVAVAPSGFITLSREMSGADGFAPGVTMEFSSITTAGDPGNGKFRLNHATPASATALYADNLEALSGSSIAGWLDTWDDTGSTLKGELLIASKSDPLVFWLFAVTGTIVDSTGYRTVAISHKAGAGALIDGDRSVWQFAHAGTNGANGSDGYSPGYRLSFDTTTTDSDPGPGKVRFSSGTFGAIAWVYVDNTDVPGNSLTTWLDSLDDASNANAKAYLRFEKSTDPTVYAEFAVTGSVVNGSGYRKIPVSPVAGVVPANATSLVATARASGTDGSGGSGTDTDRRNEALARADTAKALGSYRRYLDEAAFGFKSSGDADASSSNGAVDTTAGAWKPSTPVITVTASATLASTQSNGGLTLRNHFAAAAVSANGTYVRVKIDGPASGTAVTLNNLYIGHAAAAGDAYDFDGSQVQLLFSGVASVTPPVGGSVYSDWVALTVDETKALIVSIYISGTNSVKHGTSLGGNYNTYYKVGGDDSATTDATGYSSVAGNIYCVSEIQVKSTSATINNSTLITPYQAADAARTKLRGIFEIDPVDAITLGTDWTVEYTCNGGANWTAASTYTNCGKGTKMGPNYLTVVETEEVTCTGGTSFAARVKNLNNKNVHVYKAIPKAAA